MTERERQFAETVAQGVMARVLDSLQNPEIAERVIDTWAGQVQKVVGRVVIRAAFYVLGVLLLIASWRLGMWDKLVELMSGHKP